MNGIGYLVHLFDAAEIVGLSGDIACAFGQRRFKRLHVGNSVSTDGYLDKLDALAVAVGFHDLDNARIEGSAVEDLILALDV